MHKVSMSFGAIFMAYSAWAAPQDPTEALLQDLGGKAKTPAERASVQDHQADLQEGMNADGLVAAGIVKDAREAILMRVGMAYSDFGKLGIYKEWLTKDEGYSESAGMQNIGKELYAVLQGSRGKIWSELSAERKSFYLPLLQMMAGPVINPDLSHAEILKFVGATATIPNTSITIPKWPMVIGYMHEWQGLVLSYIQARQAIDRNTGVLQGVVRSLTDYQVIFETIYGHNGAGPTRNEFNIAFQTEHARLPEAYETPFWISAHEIVTKDAATAGVPLFENSLQKDRYAGSTRRSQGVKYSLFHKIMDRVDGVVNPRKIYLEISFLGVRQAFIEAYFGGNYHGTLALQEYTLNTEIPALKKQGFLTEADAAVLTTHAKQQILLAHDAFAARAKSVRFWIDGRPIVAEDAARNLKSISKVELSTNTGVIPFQFKTVEVNGKTTESLVDATGGGRDFIETFEREIFQSILERLRDEMAWRVASASQMPCLGLGAAAAAAGVPVFSP